MKKFVFCALFLLPLISYAQQTHNGLPVIKASHDRADYRIGNDWVRGNWRIAPEASPDVLPIACFSDTEKVVFCTDKDSISYTLTPGQSHRFYVLLNEKDYALTELKGEPRPKWQPVQFSSNAGKAQYPVRYEENTRNEYLKKLREEYKLDQVLAGAKTDTERALRMMHWTHNQWAHNGSNEPSQPDALTILEEVKQGKNFRCVEYGIVTAAALNAVGLKSRVLGLKTKDVETTASGAGHVVLETYLPDLGKWVMLDAQFDAMPVLNGKPLNAVEFQQAIATNYDKLEIRSLSGAGKRGYISWVEPYLYYFDVKFDNREGEGLTRETVQGKKNLMLVPAGAKNPEIFQQKWPIAYCLYTNSLADFYARP